MNDRSITSSHGRPPSPSARRPLRVRDLGPRRRGAARASLHASAEPALALPALSRRPSRSLAPRERACLTATDGRDHVALVALDGAERPSAIARYVRLRDRAAQRRHRRRGARRAPAPGHRLRPPRAARPPGRGGRDPSASRATVMSETGLRPLAEPPRLAGGRSIDGPSATLEVDVWALPAPEMTARAPGAAPARRGRPARAGRPPSWPGASGGRSAAGALSSSSRARSSPTSSSSRRREVVGELLLGARADHERA